MTPPIHPVRRARLLHGHTARQLADMTRGIVQVGMLAGADEATGDQVTMARRVGVLMADLRHYAVVLERLQGTPWAVVARRLGEDEDVVRARFDPWVAAFVAGDAAPWHPRVLGAAVALLPAPPDLTTEEAADALERELVGWAGGVETAAGYSPDGGTNPPGSAGSARPNR